MNEQSLLEDLSSVDYNRVIEALFLLGSERSITPSPDLFQGMINLISHRSPEIRHRAIFAVGLHWKYLAALPRIIDVLSNPEEDPEVLMCASSAVGSIAHDEATVREMIIFQLARIVVDEKMPQEVRDEAYTSALWAAQKISPDEYAGMGTSHSLDKVDWGWLNTILQK